MGSSALVPQCPSASMPQWPMFDKISTIVILAWQNVNSIIMEVDRINWEGLYKEHTRKYRVIIGPVFSA